MLGRWLAMVLLLLLPARAWAVGEGSGGFPSWEERVLHEWTNRARVDPATALQGCEQCGEAACYSPQPPLAYARALNRAARFHSDEMVEQSYFAHASACTVVANIDALYPASCGGAASCACDVAGTTATSAEDRVALFGSGWTGEIIAGASSPDALFNTWIHESSSSSDCAYSSANGHRWLILTSQGSVGMGVRVGGPYGEDGTGDFSSAAASAKVPSGIQYPRQASSVEAWANWSATAAPRSAQVDLEGRCVDLALTRGTALNGAWKATLSGVGSGCHRYFFVFQDAAGATVTYPTTGSLGIGATEAACPIWSTERPSLGTSCAAAPVVDAGTPDAGVDAGSGGPGADGGVDAGSGGPGADGGVDAGSGDPGADGGADAGNGGPGADGGVDAGSGGPGADGGVDAGSGDPGADGGVDAGSGGPGVDGGADAGNGGPDADGGTILGQPLSDAVGGCGSTGGGAGWLGLLGLAALLLRRRSRRVADFAPRPGGGGAEPG